MIFLVDTVSVEAGAVEGYLRLVHDSLVPLMEGAGVRLQHCWATSDDLGEDVQVQVAWAVEDHAAWNEARKRLVLDPAYYDCGALLAERRRSGTRRFYRPAPAW